MAITNAEAIRFSNEVVRPHAEKLRAIKAEIDAALIEWFDGINALFPNSDQEAVDDGRENEGVSRLNGEDINGLLFVMSEMQTLLNTAGYAQRISRPCVRPFQVT